MNKKSNKNKRLTVEVTHPFRFCHLNEIKSHTCKRDNHIKHNQLCAAVVCPNRTLNISRFNSIERLEIQYHYPLLISTFNLIISINQNTFKYNL